MVARLVYVMGPSGAGKDSLLGWLRAHLPDGFPLHWAQRTISRPPAASAAPGTEQHESVSPASFAALRESGAFALHWHANGLGYGIRHAQLAPLGDGHWVLVNGSRAHLPQALAAFAALLPVHITATAEVLRQRLLARGRETPDEVQARVQRALAFALPPGVPRIHICNDHHLDNAGEQLLAALRQVPGWPETPSPVPPAGGTLSPQAPRSHALVAQPLETP